MKGNSVGAENECDRPPGAPTERCYIASAKKLTNSQIARRERSDALTSLNVLNIPSCFAFIHVKMITVFHTE